MFFRVDRFCLQNVFFFFTLIKTDIHLFPDLFGFFFRNGLFVVVFLNSPCRETAKNAPKSQVFFWACFFLAAPRLGHRGLFFDLLILLHLQALISKWGCSNEVQKHQQFVLSISAVFYQMCSRIM
jgi:hypothetical protein